MRNRLRAHVLGAVHPMELRSAAVQSASASASVGAASQATHAGSSHRPASSLHTPWASDDSGTTLHMCNRWRDHVSGAEDQDLGDGSSDDDPSSCSSSPQSSPDRSASDVFPEDEPFKEDEKVVAEWRMKSYASSTIVRILCCLIVMLFLFSIWCRVRQAGPSRS